jgi:hypothetical protein
VSGPVIRDFGDLALIQVSSTDPTTTKLAELLEAAWERLRETERAAERVENYRAELKRIDVEIDDCLSFDLPYRVHSALADLRADISDFLEVE